MLFLLAAAAVMAGAIAATGDEKQPEKLVLTTDRFPHPLFLRKMMTDGTGGYFRIGLEVTLDGNGGGQGLLILDPNARVTDAFGDGTAVTEAGWSRKEVTLTAIEKDDPQKKGRRLYEIKGDDLRGTFYFVHSPDPKEPHRILVTVFPQRRETSVYTLYPGKRR
jgi:hypothetical protein